MYKEKKLFILSLLFLFPLLSFLPGNTACAQEGNAVPGEAIVVFTNKVMTTYATASLGLSTNDSISVDEVYTFDDLNVGLVTTDDYSTQELINTLKSTPGIEIAEPNYRCYPTTVTNDTYSSLQWALQNDGQLGLTKDKDTNADTAWNDNVNGSDTVVAVIDTGVDYSHEDLKDNMWVNTTTLAGTYGYDYCNSDSNPMDEDGHGTHCAGIIAAYANNQKGISGISPNTKIMALRFIGSDGGETSDAIKCYQYIYKAMQQGVNVVAVNNSWGCNLPEGNDSNVSSALSTVVNQVGEYGALSVFASGNDGEQISANAYSADVDNDYCVTVGASTGNDTLSTFSNYGDVDIAAPGESILSTVSYENFLPYIYDTAKRSSLDSIYTTFDNSDDINDYSWSSTSSSVSASISYTQQNVPASNDSSEVQGAMVINFKNTSRKEQDFTICYTNTSSLDGSPSSDTYYSSLFIENKNVWNVNCNECDSYDSSKGCLPLCTVTLGKNSNGTMIIDNLAISKANPDTSSFGKYDIYNGTSMATPYVSGAIALLSQTAPSFTSAQLKSYLLKNVRSVSSMSGKISSGGVLDLSNYKSILTAMQKEIQSGSTTVTPTPTPSATPTATPVVSSTVAVKSIRIKVARRWLYSGKKLKLTAVISPSNATNKKVKWSVNHKTYASISSKGILRAKKKGIGKKVVVTVRSVSNSSKYKRVTFKIKKKV